MLKGTERPRQYRGSCQGGPSLRLPMSTRGVQFKHQKSSRTLCPGYYGGMSEIERTAILWMEAKDPQCKVEPRTRGPCCEKRRSR